jgi:two-component system, NtrC family, sensor kinase
LIVDEFLWDTRFETGIGMVDTQHRKLVKLTNGLCNELLKNSNLTNKELDQLFSRLTDYTRYHFSAEERLMAKERIDRRHLETHIMRHGQLFEQLIVLRRSWATMVKPVQAIHTFLASWLTVHILGYDQIMARQIARLRQGQSPAEAFEAEEKTSDTGTAVLLDALGRLYDFISAQNQNLSHLNQTLEQRIEERTRVLAETSRQLLQAEKLAAVGQLAAGVAHEINNPIGYVNSNLSVLNDYMGHLLTLIEAYESGEPDAIAMARKSAGLESLREDLPALLAESQNGLLRVAKIVKDLKEFSHVDQADFQDTNLNTALESTLSVVWHHLKDKTEVVRELGEIPTVECLPAKIKQVFMNLLINASQAIAPPGLITLRSGVAGDSVWVEVADTGSGIRPNDMDRIFEPFFTTKPIGTGPGLGLTVCHDIIVKEHGGRIDVKSEPGNGSCFRVWLPIIFATG